ncbi:MAG TPA: fatty acid desaturase [Xanthobacteraceae bacterium]|jgi:stearoyl-CoA desaturase (delta-9 desaturase)|nr:fatty acid desaturase [Xanthobacteraceae bacterium]
MDMRLAEATSVEESRLPEAVKSLALPSATKPVRIAWDYTIGIVVCHLIALLAFVPWFYSRTGVVLAVLGLYVFGTLGINLCYHRLLTHRGFVCPKWLEHGFAILAVCCLQDTPARWVATHRRHHQYADEQPDPHSPWVNFFWGHVGWLLIKNDDLKSLSTYERYAKDILRDRLYKRLERNGFWMVVVVASWALFFLGGFLSELLMGGSLMDAVQFGASILVWGVFVRTVLGWHIAWSVNSLAHLWGYRNYETDEDSRNNVFVGLISNGEGWHNNHHAHPRSARHGLKWWELDVTWLTVRLLMLLGLAQKVVVVGPNDESHYLIRTHNIAVTPAE